MGRIMPFQLFLEKPHIRVVFVQLAFSQTRGLPQTKSRLLENLHFWPHVASTCTGIYKWGNISTVGVELVPERR